MGKIFLIFIIITLCFEVFCVLILFKIYKYWISKEKGPIKVKEYPINKSSTQEFIGEEEMFIPNIEKVDSISIKPVTSSEKVEDFSDIMEKLKRKGRN
jgi:hypothetical protein